MKKLIAALATIICLCVGNADAKNLTEGVTYPWDAYDVFITTSDEEAKQLALAKWGELMETEIQDMSYPWDAYRAYLDTLLTVEDGGKINRLALAKWQELMVAEIATIESPEMAMQLHKDVYQEIQPVIKDKLEAIGKIQAAGVEIPAGFYCLYPKELQVVAFNALEKCIELGGNCFSVK